MVMYIYFELKKRIIIILILKIKYPNMHNKPCNPCTSNSPHPISSRSSLSKLYKMKELKGFTDQKKKKTERVVCVDEIESG